MAVALHTEVPDPSTGIPGDTKLVPAIASFGYVRISSIEQADGYGPEVQEAAIRSYCARKSWPSPKIILESVSGESLLDRTEIKKLIVAAQTLQEAGTHVVIVFHRLDRLARTLTDQEALVYQAMKSGFRFYSTQQVEEDTLNPAYAGDPFRVMIRQIFGVFNQFERATIQSRLDSGLLEKARSGASTGGRLPFGYQAVNGDIVVDPVCVPAIRRIFELRHGGMDPIDISFAVVKEFDVCSHWRAVQVRRVLKRADLYKHGLYKTRLGIKAQLRPELVIIPSDPKQGTNVTTIKWADVPEEVGMPWLALVLNKTVSDVQGLINDKSARITWRKGKMYIAKAEARALIAGIFGAAAASV